MLIIPTCRLWNRGGKIKDFKELLFLFFCELMIEIIKLIPKINEILVILQNKNKIENDEMKPTNKLAVKILFRRQFRHIDEP